MTKLAIILGVSVVAALVGMGCGGSAPATAEVAGPTPVANASRPRNVPVGQAESAATPANTGAACPIATIYFSLDSDELDDGSRRQLSENARCLHDAGGSARVVVTGATDPRGTEEYNLALGDRRARSVKRYLTSLGVSEGALDVRSVGEEMSRGTDEPSWAQDRSAGFARE